MILFFGDIHFGSGHRFSSITGNGFTTRENEHLSCLDSLKRVLKENKITKCVFGGDMYGPVGDNISGETQCAVIKFVSELAKECKCYNIPLEMIVGNHDIIHDATVFGINKLAPFKYFDNVKLYEEPVIDGDYVYLPFSYDDEYLSNFLENIPDKKNKIIFSHVDIADLCIGGIFTNKGVKIDLLDKFKKVFEAHYHGFTQIGENIIVCGSTQRLSFKDKGVSRNNIVLYDEETGRIKRESFNCPDWLTFTDDNVNEILQIDNDNYVKVDLSMDILYTDEIKEKVEQMKDSDLHIDVSRITANHKDNNDSEVTSEDEIDIIQQFVNKSDNDSERKQRLIEKGINLINRAKH